MHLSQGPWLHFAGVASLSFLELLWLVPSLNGSDGIGASSSTGLAEFRQSRRIESSCLPLRTASEAEPATCRGSRRIAWHHDLPFQHSQFSR
jgi:hypothetical protein